MRVSFRTISIYSANSAADENDLFVHLNAAAQADKSIPEDVNVSDLFGSWSDQSGFPLLTVTRNYTDHSVKLKQEKYTNNTKLNEIDSSSWYIPYNFVVGNNGTNKTSPFGWIKKDVQEITIKSDNQTSWTDKDSLVFNKQQTGYYRVLYDEKNYDLINQRLETDLTTIDSLSRAQILDDLYEFVNTDRVSPKIFCGTLQSLKEESSYAPWAVASKVIFDMQKNLVGSGKEDNFNKVISNLVQPIYKKMTLNESENEEPYQKLTRHIAIDLACEFNVENCVKDTYAQFKTFIGSNDSVTPHFRNVAIVNGIRGANSDEIAKLWQFYVNSTAIDVRSEVVAGLANIQDEKTIEVYLNKTLDDVPDKDERFTIIRTIVRRGQKGVSATINWLLRDQVLEKVNSSLNDANRNSSVSIILQDLTSYVIKDDVNKQVSSTDY